MTERPRVTDLAGRALQLLRDGGGRGEVEALVGEELPAALAARLGGRRLEVRGAGTRVVLSGPELAPARLVLDLAPDGTRLTIALDTGGRTLPDELAHLPLEVVYEAGGIPGDHRFWSDAGGLLMVGELAAASGWR